MNNMKDLNYVDYVFIDNCIEIMNSGYSDINENVRPKWADTNKPAHTKKIFGIVNRYDLSNDCFPIQILRRINWKAAIDEILWVWQKKSNNVHDLKSHIWDQWADENGSIGKAYGYQMGRKFKYTKDSKPIDQTDYIIDCLKNNPQSRRMVTNMYMLDDLPEMNLYPCAYSCTFDVTDGYLNMILNQRSQDMLVANNWNVIQYAALVMMMADCCGFKPGILTHVIGSAHIYDRHESIVNDIIGVTLNSSLTITKRPIMNLKHHDNFYDYTIDDFELVDYEPISSIKNIPVAV